MHVYSFHHAFSYRYTAEMYLIVSSSQEDEPTQMRIGIDFGYFPCE